SFAHDSERPVLWSAVSSRQSWLVTRSLDETDSNQAELIRWDPLGRNATARREIAGILPIGLTVLGDKPGLAARDRLVLNPSAIEERSIALLEKGRASAMFAVSHDARLIAQAFGDGVQVYDAASFSPIGPRLPSSRGESTPQQLAFAAEDDQLLDRA